MKNYLFISLFLFPLFVIKAQELTLKLPFHAEKEAVILGLNGIYIDTIGVVKLDKEGKGLLNYSKKNRTGFVQLKIKNKEHLNYDFVLSPSENLVFESEGEYVYRENTKLNNSLENKNLYRWFDNLLKLKQRISLNQGLAKNYDATSDFFKVLKKEREINEELLKKLKDTIYSTESFAAHYMRFYIDKDESLANVWEDNEKMLLARKYFTQKINFNHLYGSGLWFPILNSCLEVYNKDTPFYKQFGSDIILILKKINDSEVYSGLVDAAISITEKFSWTEDQEKIVSFAIEDNRLINVRGKLKKIIDLHKTKVGNIAPNLNNIEVNNNQKLETLNSNNLSENYSLLIFYQTDCGHCEALTKELSEMYKEIESKGIKIIMVSADTDATVFKNHTENIKWAKSICDLKGFNEGNFKNYAIIGTPTMYVLDKKGVIKTKMATIQELSEWLKLNNF